MGQRGKKSAAQLSVVKDGTISAINRPDAPQDLTPEQSLEWLRVVERMPAEWFPAETHAMLAQYCRHVVSARRVAEMIESLTEGSMDSDRWVEDYDRLLKMQEREGRAMSSLATRMRISQQAQINYKKKTGSSVKKPWEK
jgi:hypothetical protein